MITMLRRSLPMALAGVVALSGASFAQTGQQPGMSEGMPATSQAEATASFSDDKLKAFAQAAMDVQQIALNYQQKIGSEADKEEVNQLQMKANQEMANAVEEQGLSIEQYNEIYQAAQADQGLAQQIQQYLE